MIAKRNSSEGAAGATAVAAATSTTTTTTTQELTQIVPINTVESNDDTNDTTMKPMFDYYITRFKNEQFVISMTSANRVVIIEHYTNLFINQFTPGSIDVAADADKTLKKQIH